jgi:hypothetical protein
LLRLAGVGLRLFAAELRESVAVAGAVVAAAMRLAARSRSASNAVLAAPSDCWVMADCCCGV